MERMRRFVPLRLHRFAAAASLPAPLPLLIKDKSYTIWSEIVLNTPEMRSTIEVRETYSSWQNRSKSEIRVLYESSREGLRPRSVVVLMDEKQILATSNHHCELSDMGVMDYQMNLNAFKGISLDRAVVGPSKALHIMSDRLGDFRSRLQSSALDGRATREPIVQYNYELNANTLAALYYYEGTSNLPFGVPFEIVLTTGPDRDHIVAYTFKRIDILTEAPIFGSADTMIDQYHSGQESQVKYDALAVQPDLNCGSKMVLESKVSNANPLLATEYRFSFQARADVPNVLGAHVHYVAYEPSIKMLRVDKVQSTKMTQTLVDFRAGELYHALKRRAQDDLVLDQIIQTTSEFDSRNDLSCIRTESPKGPVTLGEMLLGAVNVSYLGLAEVRGIEARAYIAVNSQWPTWYQQPVSYRADSKNSSSIESDTCTRRDADDDEHSLLTTLFYFSNNARVESKEAFTGQLLLIEIKREVFAALGASSIVETTSIPIFDFSWQLSSDAPDGQPIEQFFSLGDSCLSAATDDNHYAEVNLLLARNTPLSREDEADWLEETNRRNFALMQLVREKCGLPASMIYDIESSLVRATTRSAQSLHIAATMRAAEQTRPVARLYRIGRGSLRGRKRRGGISFPVTLFQACYIIAAHMKFDAYVLYSLTSKMCVVFRASELDSEGINELIDFETIRVSVEVYRIEHRPAPKIGVQGDEITQLANSQAKLNKLSKVNLVGGPKNVFEMELKRAEVRELDRQVPVEVDEVELANSNKFVGFGLVVSEDSDINRLIRPDPMGELENSDRRTQKLGELATQMTVGWCEAECLADFGCQSYSVCLRDAKVECVLSMVDFRTPYMLAQLAQLKGRKTKVGERIDLKVDRLEDKDAVVPVTKRPSCELRNKSYRQLFMEGKKNYVDVLRRRLHPVSGREQCAKLCVDVTIETLKSEVQMAHKLNAQVYSDPEKNPNEIKQAFRGLKFSTLNLCSSFLYLDQAELLALSNDARLELERFVGTPSGEGPKNGYCILGDTPREQEIDELQRFKWPVGPLSRLDMPAERHDFDFSFMFEKHHGVSLAKSAISGDLRKAFRAIQSLTAQEKEYALIWDYMSKGDNLETLSSSDDPKDCLRICFLQMSGHWPACKSVDVFEMAFLRGRETYCFFNSRTMRELMISNRTDLIAASVGEQKRLSAKFLARMTHYEPKAGFIAESLGLMTKLQISEAKVESCLHSQLNMLNLGLLGLVCTILLAKCMGVWLGVVVGWRVLGVVAERKEDAQSLVQSPEAHLAERVTMSDLDAGSANRKISAGEV